MRLSNFRRVVVSGHEAAAVAGRWRGAVIAALVLLSVPCAPWAQTTSTIEGAVSDRQGLAIAGAEVRVEGATLAVAKTVTTEADGNYRIAAITAGTYTLTVTRSGFASRVFRNLEVTLNRTIHLDVTLEIGTVQQQLEVSGQIPLLETTSSSEGATVLPEQIENMPINGRNYLDLLQLVPGVAINRQADANSDNATPVLGERANNTGFLIDGLSNQNELNGGPAAQFNQARMPGARYTKSFNTLTAGFASRFFVFCREELSEVATVSPSARNQTSDSCGRPSGPTVPSVANWPSSRSR